MSSRDPPRHRCCITSRVCHALTRDCTSLMSFGFVWTEIGRTARSSVVGNGPRTGLEKGRLCPIPVRSSWIRQHVRHGTRGTRRSIAHHRLGNTGRKCRIKEASDRGQKKTKATGCLEETFAKTDRCGRVRGGHIHDLLKTFITTSISLIQAKGIMTPPRPYTSRLCLRLPSG